MGEGLVFIAMPARLSGREGAYVRARRQEGKIVWEFFLVPKSEGDPFAAPGASPLDNSTWKNVPGAPITAGDLDSRDLGPATGLLYGPWGITAP